MPSADKRTLGHGIMVMAAMVIVLAGIKFAAVIVVPFILAASLTIILSPLFFGLQKLGLSQSIALVIVIMVLLAVVGTLFTFVSSSIQEFTHNVPHYEAKLKSDFQNLAQYLRDHHIKIPREDIANFFGANSAMDYIAQTLKALGEMLTNSMMIVFTVAFMLMDLSRMGQRLKESKDAGFQSFVEGSNSIKHFILLKTIISAVTGAVVMFALKLVGLDYAILWGVVAFLLNYIPNIGSIIAAIPAVLMALVQFDPSTALMVAGIYVLINVIIGNVIEPYVMGEGLGLSTLVVFLSLIFWGWLLGPVGMLLSVPLTILVKIALDAREETRWMGDLLGN